MEADWPTPAMMGGALRSCFESGDFQRGVRPPASWRDLAPLPLEEYVPVSACKRAYDRPETRNKVGMCSHSCCRSKGGDRCYWAAAMSECKR